MCAHACKRERNDREDEGGRCSPLNIAMKLYKFTIVFFDKVPGIVCMLRIMFIYGMNKHEILRVLGRQWTVLYCTTLG